MLHPSDRSPKNFTSPVYLITRVVKSQPVAGWIGGGSSSVPAQEWVDNAGSFLAEGGTGGIRDITKVALSQDNQGIGIELYYNNQSGGKLGCQTFARQLDASREDKFTSLTWTHDPRGQVLHIKFRRASSSIEIGSEDSALQSFTHSMANYTTGDRLLWISGWQILNERILMLWPVFGHCQTFNQDGTVSLC